ncbi:MAG: hypothetical protein ACRDUA_03695 [Micromonosporaceae bacterium]
MESTIHGRRGARVGAAAVVRGANEGELWRITSGQRYDWRSPQATCRVGTGLQSN